MIKKIVTLVVLICFFTVSAQLDREKIAYLDVNPPTFIEKYLGLASSCLPLSIINPTANFSIYTVTPSTLTPGCSPFAGYLFGTNCYGFKEASNFFNAASYSSVVNPSITSVSVGFYRNPINGRGTHGSGAVSLKIYSGTSNTLAPGSLITSTTVNLSSIIASQTGTFGVFVYTFTLSPSTLPTSGFFASLNLPTSVGDTAVIATQTTSTATFTTPNAWLQNAASNWSNVATSYGVNLNCYFVPGICGTNVDAGISTNLSLNNKVKIMPNPSTGIINLAFSFEQAEKVAIVVTDALGQEVLLDKQTIIVSDTLSIDLSNKPNGVYFITVKTNKDRMIRRLILSR